MCPASQQRNEIFQEASTAPLYPSRCCRHEWPDVPPGKWVSWKLSKIGAGNPVYSIHRPALPISCARRMCSRAFPVLDFTEAGDPGQSPNSSFITVAPVPEDLTTITVTGQLQEGWINSQTATVNFVSTPPAVASTNDFVAAPIESLTYGISSNSNVPQPPAPIPGDFTLNNSLPARRLAEAIHRRPLSSQPRRLSTTFRRGTTCCITLPRTAPALRS